MHQGADSSVSYCAFTQETLVGLMKSSFVSNQVMLSCVFIEVFSPDIKFNFHVYFCLLKETFRTVPQLALSERAAVVLLHFPLT